MSFKIIIPKSVEKEINILPDKVADKIIDEIRILSINPYPQGSKRLTTREGWRIRIGDYRIINDINNKSKEIILRKIAHRKDIYK